MGQRVENRSPEKMIYEESDTVGNEGSSDSDRDDDKTAEDRSLDSLMKTFKSIRNSVPQPMPLLLLQMHKAQK